MGHLASEQHLCNSVDVIELLEQVIVDNEIGESELEQPHVVRGSVLLDCLLFILVFEHLSGIAQLLLNWLLDMIGRNYLVLSCIITFFVRSARLRDRILFGNGLRHWIFCFDLFESLLLLRLLHDDTHPDFLPKLLSFRHQSEVAHIVARLSWSLKLGADCGILILLERQINRIASCHELVASSQH